MLMSLGGAWLARRRWRQANGAHSTTEETSRVPRMDSSSSSDVDPTSAGDERRHQAAITFSVDHILGRSGEDKTKGKEENEKDDEARQRQLPAWVHCSRFSARPTAGRSVSVSPFLLLRA